MDSLFNKKSILISLVLICTMHSFSVLKSMELTVNDGKEKTKKLREKKKRRVKQREKSPDAPTGEDATSSQDQEPGNSDEPESPSSPGRLKRILSKFMCTLRAAKSLATKKKILIAMIAVITIFYQIYHVIPTTIDPYFHEEVVSNQVSDLQACQLSAPTEVREYNKWWPYLYNMVAKCSCYQKLDSIVFSCKMSLETIGLGDYWERISDAATRMCQDSAWCTALTNKLPEAATCWATWEALKKLPKVFQNN